MYFSFGTVISGLPFASAAYRATLEALATLPVRVLLTLGRGQASIDLGEIPANVHVEEWVAQCDALSQASLVVCHGGSGTTFGALEAGIPLVVIPFMADQPSNGAIVEQAGAGLMVQPERLMEGGLNVVPERDAPRIRAAIQRVLTEDSFRGAAQAISGEMQALPRLDQLLTELLDAGKKAGP